MNFKSIFSSFFPQDASAINLNQGEANLCEVYNLDIPSSFTKIEVDSIVEIEMESGPSLSVTLECPANLRKNVHVKVESETLVATVKGTAQFNGGAKLKVTSPYLIQKVTADGASSVKLRKVLAPSLNVYAGGAARVKLEGACVALNVIAEGACSVKAEAVTMANLTIESDGAASVKVAAGQVSTAARANGASSIKLKGTSPQSSIKASIASSIKTNN